MMQRAGLGRVAVLNQIASKQLKATLNTSGVTPFWEASLEDFEAWQKTRRKRGRPRKDAS